MTQREEHQSYPKKEKDCGQNGESVSCLSERKCFENEDEKKNKCYSEKNIKGEE